MLRRLDEAHKQMAVSELRMSQPHRLRDQPHTGTSRKPDWPTEAQLDHLRELGVHLSHFVLEPGDYVHINKASVVMMRRPLAQRLARSGSSISALSRRAEVHAVIVLSSSNVTYVGSSLHFMNAAQTGSVARF